MHNITAQVILDVIAVSYQNAVQYETLAQMDSNSSNIHAATSQESGNELVDQFKSKEIMTRLVGYMLDRSYPGTSVVTNGINIIIELIRRYCSEIEFAEYQQHHYQQQMEAQATQHNTMVPNGGAIAAPSIKKLAGLSKDLTQLLHVVGERLPDFANILSDPRTPVCVYLIIRSRAWRRQMAH
jgi:hypothetical protein